jgi:hypothetical protein
MRQLRPSEERAPLASLVAGDPSFSELTHWPVQLMLVPPHAPFLQGADLLICADCVPFAYPDFHRNFLAGKVVLVGCPKLDNLQLYAEKFKQIYAQAKPASVTVLKMEVPCCNGIAQAAVWARNEAASEIPLTVVTISIRGEKLAEQPLRTAVA